MDINRYTVRLISIHALLAEGDGISSATADGDTLFLSTPSSRRATLGQRSAAGLDPISIHALLAEGDKGWAQLWQHYVDFYPRPPRGGRPAAAIHGRGLAGDFYPRPPRGGRPPSRLLTSLAMYGFLSTPSSRRATVQNPTQRIFYKYFYPRPPRGGRLRSTLSIRHAACISIHALLAEGDCRTETKRRSTMTISIHALLAEGDRFHILVPVVENDFYPRPPRGGRLYTRSPSNVATIFLSTPSSRRATDSVAKCYAWVGISIHALLAEGDSGQQKSDDTPIGISIHALLAEGDRGTRRGESPSFRFLSTPSSRRATNRANSKSRVDANFYPRPPRGGRPR